MSLSSNNSESRPNTTQSPTYRRALEECLVCFVSESGCVVELGAELIKEFGDEGAEGFVVEVVEGFGVGWVVDAGITTVEIPGVET